MEGIETHHIGAVRPDDRGQLAQIGEVADTPVSIRPQKEQVHGKTPETPVVCTWRKPAFAGCHDQDRFTLTPIQAEPVVAPREICWQHQSPALERIASVFARFAKRKLTEGYVAGALLSIFKDESPAHQLTLPWQTHQNIERITCVENKHGR
jgi:hypothetical protein